MIEFLKDIIRDLIPGGDTPNHVWLTRIFTLFFLSVFFAFSLVYIFSDTNIGVKYGLDRVSKPVRYNAKDFHLLRRTMFGTLTRIREENYNVDSAFVLVGIDRETGNILFKERSKSFEVVAFVWQIPNVEYSSLRTFDDLMGVASTYYDPLLQRKRGECISGDLTKTELIRLRTAISQFDANRWCSCPLLNRKGQIIASVLVYWRNDPTVPSQDIIASVKRNATSLNAYVNDFAPSHRSK